MRDGIEETVAGGWRGTLSGGWQTRTDSASGRCAADSRRGTPLAWCHKRQLVFAGGNLRFDLETHRGI